jgi:hypothetical protein
MSAAATTAAARVKRARGPVSDSDTPISFVAISGPLMGPARRRPSPPPGARGGINARPAGTLRLAFGGPDATD